MQIEAADSAEKLREASADPGGDGDRAIALRSELARKIAAHIHVEGDQVTSVPGLVLFRRTAPTSCYSATLRTFNHHLRAGPEACQHRRDGVCVRRIHTAAHFG